MVARTTLTVAAVLLLSTTQQSWSQEYLSGLKWPEPEVVTPGDTPGAPPSDAVVLFDGTDLSAFRNGDAWRLEDGAMVVGKGDLYSHQEFGDCQLHLEWAAPEQVKGKGQGRGNSGVFFMAFQRHSRYNGYEVQILDSYQNATYHDGQAAAIYKQQPPLVNAMRPPGQWNTYDVCFTAPRFAESGELESPAYVTVIHNGVLVQNHFELKGETCWFAPARYLAHPPRGPIRLQEHGNPVRYRNIWVREIKPMQAQKVHEPLVRRDGKLVPYDEGE